MQSLNFLLLFLFITLNCNIISQQIEFAVIGDYGKAGSNESAVAQLVNSWNPDFIITLGDNNYEYGGKSTIDTNIGYYYHDYIFPYRGIYGLGSDSNRFFPSLGNHDLDSLLGLAYFDYFALPNNERYYDFIIGNIHFFALNSDPREPDGVDSNSVQATWLKNKLAASNARFKIVYFHHAPFSSSQHGSSVFMQWNFKQWGASIVLAGHDHTYERLSVNNFTYIVNGLGGKSIYNFVNILPESVIRYNENYGAQLVTVYNDSIVFKFYNIENNLIDSYTLFYIPVGINFINNETPVNFLLEQNYPNPFNNSTLIQFKIPSDNAYINFPINVSLNLFDSAGRFILNLYNGLLNPGSYEVNFNAENFSSGIYFYTLHSDYFTDTKKMILIK